jgi:hypothetical protein
MPVKQLPTVTLAGTRYYVDERLGEIRNVDDPCDSEDVSPDLIEQWRKIGWLKEARP